MIGRHNYVLNSETVLKDAYRLLNIVLADEAIAHIVINEGDPLVLIRDKFVEDELVHLLISTAVMNRIHDDHMAQLREGRGDEGSSVCGSWNDNLNDENQNESRLNFREACNKIIHAQQITVEFDESTENAFPTLNLIVVLRGTKNRNPWQAHLNIPNYVRETFKNFQDL